MQGLTSLKSSSEKQKPVPTSNNTQSDAHSRTYEGVVCRYRILNRYVNFKREKEKKTKREDEQKVKEKDSTLQLSSGLALTMLVLRFY